MTHMRRIDRRRGRWRTGTGGLNSGIGRSLRAYRDLLRIPGARGFVLAGSIGRYPISMRALACLLMVLATTGSYAIAGAVSSVVTLATAVAVPALGRLSDRRGQQWLVLVALVVHVGGIVALVLLATWRAPVWTLVAAGVVFGGSALPLGSLGRARWAALVGGTPRLQTAYALEAFIDDIIYLTGPVIVTVLSARLVPTAGMLVILGMVLVGWIAFALQRSTQPPLASPGAAPSRIAVTEPGLRALLLVCVALGAWLGSSNVALVAFAEEQGDQSLGGILIGCTILGGMVAGLVYGGISWRLPLVRRLLGTTVLLGIGSLPMIFMGSFWWMVPFAVFAGLAITPTLIGIYSVLTNVVAKTSVTEGFAWIASSITVGSSTGVAVSGWLVDRSGSRGSLIFLAAMGLLCPVVVALNQRLLGRAPHAAPARRDAPVDSSGAVPAVPGADA